MKNKNKKLFYRWTGCPCSASEEVEVDLKTWSNVQIIWGYDENLADIDTYKISDVIHRLNHGEKEVRIANVCHICFGTGEDIYYFKEI
jgi:hypothetical protein